MKKTLLALALMASAGVAVAAEPAPEFALTGNINLYSDYRFRGISQTARKPAFQGGLDLAHSSGLYVGNWNSNVSNDLYPGASLEQDFYAGYKFALGDFAFDVGNLYYYYGGSREVNPAKKVGNPRNNEVYASVGFGPATFKVNRSTTNYFGAADTKGTMYYDLSIAQPITEQLSVLAHAGYTDFKDAAKAGQYADYLVGVKYALPKDFAVGLNYQVSKGSGAQGQVSTSGKDLAGHGLIAYVSKTF